MRVVQTLLVRDEIELVRLHVDYHLDQGVDLLLVTDNGSVDGTTDVLDAFARQGRVRWVREPPSDFSQHRWVTRMARRAFVEHGADWVLHADADEFLLWRGGTVREALARLPADVTHFYAPRHDFVPLERPGVRSAPEEMRYRQAGHRALYGPTLLPKIAHRGAADVEVGQGNHDAASARFSREAPAAPLEVFHYPVRSYPQFERKVRNAGSGYARNRTLPPGTGLHKRRWYRELLEGRLEETYRAYLHEARSLRAALESGELVEDRALAERLAARARAA